MDQQRFATKSRFLALMMTFIALIGLFGVAFSHWHGALWAIHYNPYALLSMIPFVLTLCLLFYLISKPARTDERIWLCLYLASLAVFSGGEMMQRLMTTPEAALFWTTLSAIGTTTSPAALYLFALSYTNTSDRRYPGTTTILLTTSLILMFFYSFTGFIFNNDPTVMKLFPWGYNNDTEPGLIFPLVWLDFLLILAVARFIHFRRRTRNSVLRKQNLVFIAAAVTPVAGGTITDGILPMLGFDNLPPMAVLLATATGVFLTYGVLRFQLLSISPVLFSQTILAIMHESVVVVDRALQIVYLNPEAESLLGVKGLHSETLYLSKFMTSESQDKLKHGMAEAGDHTISLDRLDVEGSKVTPVHLTISRLMVPDFEAYVIVLSDITAEVESKSIIEHQVQVRTEELRQARAYLTASINSLEQGFVLLDAKAGIAFMNGQAVTLAKIDSIPMGQPIAVALAHISWDIQLPETVAEVMQLKKAKQLQATSTDGAFYTVFVTPVVEDETVLGAAVIIEDVTEQRILDRSRDEFFSIASHELRTPLTAIRGNMGMIESYFPEAMKDEMLASAVHDSHEASVRLIEIVNDFLDSSRLEQGKMSFNMEPVAIKPLVAEAQKELDPIMKERKHTLTVDIADDMPMAYADSAKVQQILFNMIGNAAKYSEQASITVTEEVVGRRLIIRVADTGKGISPEHQHLLFHKFQQAGDSILTRDNTKGTGLGLYISKLLATNMKGDIVLEWSEEGKGSRFALALPLATKQQLKAAATPPAPEPVAAPTSSA